MHTKSTYYSTSKYLKNLNQDQRQAESRIVTWIEYVTLTVILTLALILLAVLAYSSLIQLGSWYETWHV